MTNRNVALRNFALIFGGVEFKNPTIMQHTILCPKGAGVVNDAEQINECNTLDCNVVDVWMLMLLVGL